jgi:hypothetical protein
VNTAFDAPLLWRENTPLEKLGRRRRHDRFWLFTPHGRPLGDKCFLEEAIMKIWQSVPNEHYPIPGVAAVEHAEFGRSTADVFPIPEKELWEVAVDGEMVCLATDHDTALRDAEIEAWNSEPNNLYARRTRM